MRSSYTAALVAALVTPAIAHAQNLVQNGGFETVIGSYSPPWSGYNDLASTARAHSGAVSYALYSVPTENGLTFGPPAYTGQTLATTPGTTYVLDFWAAVSPFYFGFGAVDVDWGGARVGSYAYDAGSPESMPFTEFALALTANSRQTQLQFFNDMNPCIGSTCDDAGAFVYLDDVSVTAAPEPAPLVLTLGGVAVLGAGAWRRRRAA